MMKVYGFYQLNWNASLGAFMFAQSGQPWEAWNRIPYIPIGPFDTLDDGMYVEPAGSRRSDPHAQLDLNYTQNFRLGGRYTLQVLADVYNVFDKQTGYSFEPRRANSAFGKTRTPARSARRRRAASSGPEPAMTSGRLAASATAMMRSKFLYGIHRPTPSR